MTDYENKQLGSITISDEVIATIATKAASSVENVYGLSYGIGAGITELLGVKNFNRGVKVETHDRSCNIDIFVDVLFGAKIDEVGVKIQNEVKNSVESMTDLVVNTVNVHVKGVKNLPKEN